MLYLDKPYEVEDHGATICSRLVLQGKLRLLTPLIIGGGSSLYGDSDIVVLKDNDGNPYIPSSSITGALRHYFNSYNYKGSEDEYEYKRNKLWFWGGEYQLKKDEEEIRCSCQSAIIISDLMLSDGNKAQVTIRDGIRINTTSRVVEHGAKYDFEVVEPGVCFDFYMEVIIRKTFNKNLFKSFFDWIVYQLSQAKVALGARTNQGFGRCRLENISNYMFNYENKDDIIAWLAEDGDKVLQAPGDYSQVNNLFEYKNKQFSIKANFRIKSSLIVGSYSGDPAAPDKVHIKSYKSDGGTEKIAVLPGTSVRGAIRSHAERIINTLGGNGVDMLKDLFGWVDDKPDQNGNRKAIKGRIKIEEKPITINTYVEEIQHRIKIDRFTGGVINNALFDSMPIWASGGNESMVTLELSISNYKAWEVGLMLLVLKDLWISDLAIGGEKNVGRGTLLGQRAIICLDDQRIIMEQKEKRLALRNENDTSDWDEKIAQKLEGFIQELHQELEGNEVLSSAE